MNRKCESDLEHYQHLKEWRKRAEQEKDRLEAEIEAERNNSQVCFLCS